MYIAVKAACAPSYLALRGTEAAARTEIFETKQVGINLNEIRR